MTNEERDVISKLMAKTITKQDFINYFQGKTKNKEYILELLKLAYKEKNADDIEFCLYICFVLELHMEDSLQILCDLLKEHWHYQHENILIMLQELKDPKSVDFIYQTAKTKYEYLEYNDCYSLIIKCCWALGDINTNESLEKLKQLSQSNNEIIKDAAIEQLKRKEKY